MSEDKRDNEDHPTKEAIRKQDKGPKNMAQ